jgi:pimeloyl-ACP methyl ester carboxylesterase
LSRTVRSVDGTPIAVFSSGHGPPILLVHGAAADHTTWRVVGPLLGERWTVHAIDRRGRGASGDGPSYDVAREFEDVAAVARSLADDDGRPIPVIGHSFGGRVALGAALAPSDASGIGHVVSYEGAPAPLERPYQPDDLVARLRALADAGRPERLLVTFLREVVAMGDAELAAYRANPVWPARVAAAPTIVRELEAEASPDAGLERLGAVRLPVLQVLGSESVEAFRAATVALDARLRDGRVAVVQGARHAAHHSHAAEFVRLVESFASEP